MVPGEDVVWIEVPFSILPEDSAATEESTIAEGIQGCTNDPCNMGFAPNDIQIVANIDFLEQEPAARKLFEVVEIPLEDIAAQNVLLAIDGENSEDDIQRHADQWILRGLVTVRGRKQRRPLDVRVVVRAADGHA